MSTALTTRNTHGTQGYEPHTRVRSRSVGAPTKKRTEPSPKPKPTAARRKDRPRTERIEVFLDARGKHSVVPKLITPEYTPTSSPGPITPPTPQPSSLAASILSKHSRSSLRPPTDERKARTTIHRPRPTYAYSRDVKPDLKKSLKDSKPGAADVKLDAQPDLKPDTSAANAEPGAERVRNLKSLEAYGVRFVQRTDDMRGTQVLARDADFAADVAYLSRVSTLDCAYCTPRGLWAR